MSLRHADDESEWRLPDVSRDELLLWDAPFPSPEDLRIDGLTEEQEEAFWMAISET